MSKFDPKVKQQQEALQTLGYKLPEFGADGVMGSETRQAMQKFEKSLGTLPKGKTVEQVLLEKAAAKQAAANKPVTPKGPNERVRQIQEALQDLGYKLKDGADGYMGPQTKAAMKDFHDKHVKGNPNIKPGQSFIPLLLDMADDVKNPKPAPQQQHFSSFLMQPNTQQQSMFFTQTQTWNPLNPFGSNFVSTTNTNTASDFSHTSTFTVADLMKRFDGLSEDLHTKSVYNLITKDGGYGNWGNVKSDSWAWCAAAMNSVLRMAGAKQCYGTDAEGNPALTQSATGFASYGTKSEKPKVGDIVVFRDSNDKTKGHVGFVEDIIYDKKGRIVDLVVFGGNQKNQFCSMKASDMGWKMSEVLAYRNAPDVSGQKLAEAMKKADKIMETAKESPSAPPPKQKQGTGKHLTR